MMKYRNGIVAGSCIALLIWGCGDKKEIENKSIGQIQKEQGVPVQVYTVKKDVVAQVQKFSGEVTGARQKGVYATLPEYIRKIPVSVGEYVEKDQILAELDTDGVTPYYKQAKAAYEIAQKTYERVKSVFENGGVSQQQLDEAETQYKVRQADFISSQKQAFVLAPFSGVIIDIFFKEGGVAIAGKDEYPMMTIAQVDRMLMKINVSHTEIHAFKNGMKAIVKIGDKEIQGKITKVPLAASVVNRFFNVEILFNNQNMILKPGMFIQAEVIIKEEQLPSIPIEAVLFEKEGAYVYKVEGDTAKKVAIKTQIITDDAVGVASGISANDVIVVNGMSKLGDVTKITVLK